MVRWGLDADALTDARCRRNPVRATTVVHWQRADHHALISTSATMATMTMRAKMAAISAPVDRTSIMHLRP